jgi:hypothetical protein
MNADMLPRLAARPEPHRTQPPHDSRGWGEAPLVIEQAELIAADRAA